MDFGPKMSAPERRAEILRYLNPREHKATAREVYDAYKDSLYVNCIRETSEQDLKQLLKEGKVRRFETKPITWSLV